MNIEIELQHCNLKLKLIGTQQEIELHEWCHSKRGRSDAPLVKRGKKKSKSPKKNLLDNATTSVRFCMNCGCQRMFIHKTSAPHSRCEICNSTHSSRGGLNTKINKCIKNMR